MLFQHYAIRTPELIIKILRKCKKLTRQYCTEIVGHLLKKPSKQQCYIVLGKTLEKLMFRLHSHNTSKISNPFFIKLIQTWLLESCQKWKTKGMRKVTCGILLNSKNALSVCFNYGAFRELFYSDSTTHQNQTCFGDTIIYLWNTVFFKNWNSVLYKTGFKSVRSI